MTVAQWIEWLKTKPQDADLLLRDPDTDWILPLRTDPVYEVDREGAPLNSVLVFAHYSDH